MTGYEIRSSLPRAEISSLPLIQPTDRSYNTRKESDLHLIPHLRIGAREQPGANQNLRLRVIWICRALPMVLFTAPSPKGQLYRPVLELSQAVGRAGVPATGKPL